MTHHSRQSSPLVRQCLMFACMPLTGCPSKQASKPANQSDSLLTTKQQNNKTTKHKTHLKHCKGWNFCDFAQLKYWILVAVGRLVDVVHQALPAGNFRLGFVEWLHLLAGWAPRSSDFEDYQAVGVDNVLQLLQRAHMLQHVLFE